MIFTEFFRIHEWERKFNKVNSDWRSRFYSCWNRQTDSNLNNVFPYIVSLHDGHVEVICANDRIIRNQHQNHHSHSSSLLTLLRFSPHSFLISWYIHNSHALSSIFPRFLHEMVLFSASSNRNSRLIFPCTRSLHHHHETVRDISSEQALEGFCDSSITDLVCKQLKQTYVAHV